MHFTCRSFSANSESPSWSRFWENESDDSTIKSTKGHLFGLINLNSGDNKDLNSIGHDISYELNQIYFNSETTTDTLNNLQQAINSVTQNPLYADYQIDLLIAVVLNNQLYLAITGDCQVILKRHDQISLLLSGAYGQTEILSGPIQNQDRIFLLTNSFFEKITWVKIKQYLSDPKIQNVEENFLSAIYSLNDQKDLAAAFIETEVEENLVVTEDNNQTTVFEPIINIAQQKSNFLSLFKKNKKTDSVFVVNHQTNELNKRKKFSIITISLLLIILVSSVYFGHQKNQSNKNEQQYQQLKSQLEDQINKINQTKTLNFDSATSIANEAQKTLSQILALNLHPDEIEKYNSELKNFLSQTGSSTNFTPDFVYDVSQIVNQSQFKKIIFNNNQLYLFDPTNGRLDSFNPKNQSTKNLISSPKLKTATNFVFDNTNLYILSPEGISLLEKNSLTSKIKFDKLSATDFKFWNGAAYVLDSTNQSIWKFTPNSTGFSKAQSWLKNNDKLDTNSTSLSIDGKIWVLAQNGLISSYLSGVKNEFNPNQNPQYSNTDHLNVAPNKDILAFSDNGNIVYLFQKSGELLSKFNLGELKINDLTVDEASNLIYLLGLDQKIYSIKF